jgi:restriction endonuclease S subunit
VSVRFERLRDLIVEARPGFASGERDTTGVLQLRMGSVTFSGNVNWSKAVRVPAPSDLPRYELINGDVVFNNTNSQELVGRASLVDGVPERATFSNHITRLRCCDRLDPGYLVFWLNSRWVAGFFFKFAHRWVGQSAIQVARLLDLEIPLPPFDEQRRIAARLRDQLREVDGLAAGARTRNTELADVRISVYETAFPITPLSVTADSASPDGWTWRSLGALGRLESGHTPSRSRPDWWGGDIPWIALPDIRALDGRHVFETLERTNPEGIAHSAARVLPAGTVVLSRTASVGFVTIMGRPMATSQDFVNWVCGPDLDPGFLMHLFIRSRERFRSLSAGAVHKTVYFPTAMALRVCVPPFDEQRRIADRLREQLAEIDRAKAALETQQKAVDALPAALLREVFGPIQSLDG